MNALLIACVSCGANGLGETNNAGGYSILFMLGVILAMLGGVSFFLFRMIRRSNAMLEPELRDQPVDVLPLR